MAKTDPCAKSVDNERAIACANLRFWLSIGALSDASLAVSYMLCANFSTPVSRYALTKVGGVGVSIDGALKCGSMEAGY